MSKITEMLDDGYFVAEQNRVYRTRRIGRVIDVQGINTDQHNTGVNEIFRGALCEKWMPCHVGIGVPVLIPPGVQQHGLALEVHSAEYVVIDPACSLIKGTNDDSVKI